MTDGSAEKTGGVAAAEGNAPLLLTLSHFHLFQMMSPQTSFFDLSNIYLSGLNLKFGTILRRDDEAEAQQGTAIQLKVSLQIMLFFFTDERCPILFIVELKNTIMYFIFINCWKLCCC